METGCGTRCRLRRARGRLDGRRHDRGPDAARRLVKDGFRVGILSSSGKGEALAEELGGVGVTGSNRSVADVTALVGNVMDRWGRIDVLVNSAGHGPKGPVLEISDDGWHEGMEVYLLNAIRPARLVTPIMQKQGGGAIINISTFAAFEPDPLFPTSGVFRAGLAAFAKLFATGAPGHRAAKHPSRPEAVPDPSPGPE